RRAAADRAHSEVRADAHDESIEIGLVALTLQHSQRVTEERDGRGEPFPAAAMRGEDQRSASRRQRLINEVLVVNLGRALQDLSIETGEPYQIHQRLLEVVERAADDGAQL